MTPTETTPPKRDYKSSLFVNMFGRNVNAKEHFLSLDLTVKIYNINKNANHPILQKCEALLAYSNFTEYARIGKQNGEKNPPKYALNKCKHGNLLTEYFNNLSREEQSMIFGEWDQEKFIQVQKQIAAEDATEATKIANAKNALRMGLSLEQAAKITDLPLAQVCAIREELALECKIPT